MKYKYQEDYDKLSEICPPADYKSLELNPVFRWVFDSITDERNFKSQYHKNPKRFLNKDDIIKCNALALSMFNTRMGSLKRFNELKDNIGENIYLTLGTKIARGKITLADGVNGKIERHGHFNHHPSTLSDYSMIFTITVDTL